MAKKINPPGAMHAPRDLSTLKRFFGMVEESGGCWIWTGHKDRHGYGQFKVNGRAVWVHRWSYAFFKRRLRAGDEVDHLCKTPSCVNPEHLRRTSTNDNRSRGGTNGNRVRWGSAVIMDDDCPI